MGGAWPLIASLRCTAIPAPLQEPGFSRFSGATSMITSGFGFCFVFPLSGATSTTGLSRRSGATSGLGLRSGATSTITSGAISGLISGRTSVLISGRISGRTSGLISGRISGLISGRISGLISGRISGLISVESRA